MQAYYLLQMMRILLKGMCRQKEIDQQRQTIAEDQERKLNNDIETLRTGLKENLVYNTNKLNIYEI